MLITRNDSSRRPGARTQKPVLVAEEHHRLGSVAQVQLWSECEPLRLRDPLADKQSCRDLCVRQPGVPCSGAPRARVASGDAAPPGRAGAEVGVALPGKRSAAAPCLSTKLRITRKLTRRTGLKQDAYQKYKSKTFNDQKE